MGNLLIVDDNADFRLMLQQKFTSLGHKVYGVGDGVRGVQAVMEHPIDLVLLDMSMPHRGGVETLKLIRSFNAKIKVFIVSALVEEPQQKELLALGVSAILLKPISMKDLVEKVQNVLGGA